MLSAYGTAQVSVNAIVECPPCRPISGCGVCWENQQQADICTINKSMVMRSTKKTDLIIRPNPVVNGSFTLIYTEEITGKITIVNQQGAIVKTIEPSNTKSNQMTININLESGLYFVIYYDAQKKEKITKKLLFTK